MSEAQRNECPLDRVVRRLHACPLCGGRQGYSLQESDSYRYWVVVCEACKERLTECRSDRRTRTGTNLPTVWPDADDAWNSVAAHAQHLRSRIAELEDGILKHLAHHENGCTYLSHLVTPNA
jgi:hypothetical protein